MAEKTFDPEQKTQPDQENMQEEIRQRFPDLVRDGEIVLVTMTDIGPSGDYRKGWLVLTTERLFTAYEADSGTEQDIQPDICLEIPELRNVYTEHFVGNGVLSVETEEQTLKLIRFSLTFAEDFAEAADTIWELTGGEKRERKGRPENAEEQEQKRCPECGTVLKAGVCPNCIEKGQVLKRVLSYLKPYLPQAIAAFVMLLTTSALSLAPPYLTGRLVDEVLIVGDLAQLRNFVILLAAIHIAASGIDGVRIFIMTRLGQAIIRDLRSEVFHHLQYLKMRFFDSIRTGSIMSRTTSDTRNLQRFIVQSSQKLLRHALMVIAVGVMLFMYDARLALVTIAPMPIIVLATKLFSHKMHRIYRRIWVRRALMNSVVADSVPGIKVVKSFAQEKQEIDKFDHRSDQLFDQRVQAGKFKSMFRPFLKFATSIGTLIIWGYGGYLVIVTQRLSVGDLVAFLYFVNRFYNPLRQVFQFSDIVQEAATAASRVFEILDTDPEFEKDRETVHLDQVEGEIELEDVCFSYEAHERVLEDINLRIEPGEMVGLVGSSGSGKSTLVNLIPRLYDVSSGRLTIDGYDIRELDLKTLRANIGVVLQDPILFHGTIAENIAYGKPEAELEEIIWAAQAANAHDFIMECPDGYDTHTGERGLRLSGGQKQRISIARALLKNPKILILDEATSAVDTKTEQLIQEAIDRLIQDRTTIAIAHRLSTLKNADKLVVLEEGRIVEMGTHKELMEKNGVFARLIRMQAEAEKAQAV